MSVIRDLLIGGAFLAPIGVGVGLVAAFGRDRTANEHDLWAYHGEPTAELEPRRHIPPAAWPQLNRKPELEPRRIHPAAALTGPVDLAAWEPPAASVDGPVPPLARALLIELAVPTLSEAVVRATADDWLREIGEAERAKAGIVRVVSPATDRDLTGAFAVVAVA